MKYFLALVLSCFALAAQASEAPLVVAVLKNQAGGAIAFTSQAQNCRGGRLYTLGYSAGGSEIPGCWEFRNPFFVVTWSDGDVRSYHYDDVTINPKFRAYMNSRSDNQKHTH